MSDPILAVVTAVRQIIDQQTAEAHARQSNDAYCADGRHLSQDEFQAIVYAEAIALSPRADEANDASRYLSRLLSELEERKKVFRRECDDPQGVGIATLHQITAGLRKLADRA